ncbi:MAG: hypothetical protein JRF63_04700 [Deltaproteobacteria bacterium]|nr:hypothetical protein [Deltaproteobacteria bacterium]
MTKRDRDPLYGAAILKLSFLLRGKTDEPGFRVVYYGTLKELGLTNSEVNAYIATNRAQLQAVIKGEQED